MNKCKKCNEIYEINAKFCVKCGTGIEEPKEKKTIIEPNSKIFEDNSRPTRDIKDKTKINKIQFRSLNREQVFALFLMSFGLLWIYSSVHLGMGYDLMEDGYLRFFILTNFIEGIGLCACGAMFMIQKINFKTHALGFISAFFGIFASLIAAILSEKFFSLGFIMIIIESYIVFFFYILIRYRSKKDIQDKGKGLVFSLNADSFKLKSKNEFFSNIFMMRFSKIAQPLLYILVTCLVTCMLFQIPDLSLFLFFECAAIVVLIFLTLQKNILSRFLLTIIAMMIEMQFLIDLCFFENYSQHLFEKIIIGLIIMAIFVVWSFLTFFLLDIHFEKE